MDDLVLIPGGDPGSDLRRNLRHAADLANRVFQLAKCLAVAKITLFVTLCRLRFAFGRSSSWRAMHAFSLSHGLYLWFGLEPGRKLTLPLGLHFWYTANMKKSITVHQKPRGRPATGRDPAVTIRLPEAVLASVEHWAVSQKDQPPRSQAIRRLVELGLKAKK
jgi:hypothetical protein